MKKYLSRLSVFILILSMTLGFGSTTAFAYSEDAVTQVTEYYFQIWNETDFQQYIDMGVITDETVLEQYTQWQEIKNQIGDYEEETEVRVEEVDDTVVVTLVEKYTNSSVHFVITFDKAAAEQDPSYAILSIDATLPTANGGEANMVKAGMNTLMGMGIVFLVLIFISVIIWLLKFVPALFEKKKKEEPVAVPDATAPVPVAVLKEADDTELVAVITAAIMALRAEENGGDGSGFTVRSIRRRHS